ncbi:MAG: PAS domain-containing protein, partial [Elusimicrobia bacterium]|nr:PAS domain-containing protein [Elusimicrobiota bacterium]
PPAAGFGSFIRGLVEKAVPDPAERARIYADAVRHVEHAIARHVSDATHRLMQEKQGVVNERVRTESVLTTVAHGKVVVDQDGRVLMMDPAAEAIVGRPFSEVAGKSLVDEVAVGEQFVALSKDLILPENRPVSEEMRTGGAPDTMSAFRSSVAVVHDERGRVVGAYAVLPHEAKFRETQRLQEEFVANVTHDLKAPLTSVCSALEVLASKLGAGLADEDREFLDICVRNTRTLRQMIDELLDFSKIRSGYMTVHPERAGVESLLADCAQALRPWAVSKRVALEIEAREKVHDLPAVFADKGRVLQVLSNLVSNAIKYTAEGGKVVLSAEAGSGERAGKVVVRVRDTGTGITAEDLKRIFDRFTQGTAVKREGVGLGLTIARELVAQHRGEIWAESEPGKGSVFSFTLPVYGQPAPIPARRATDRRPDAA